jgi:hypothetical protein
LVVIGAPEQIFDQLDALGRADINDRRDEHLQEDLGGGAASFIVIVAPRGKFRG